jgi:hypothetical protein
MGAMSRILKSYVITYEQNGVSQVKHLVSRQDYDNIIKPLQHIIDTLEGDNKGRSTKASTKIKEALKDMFCEVDSCFPENCPLHDSTTTGVLFLTEHQGGGHKVSWEEMSFS